MSELGGLEALLAGLAKPGVYRWAIPVATRRSDVTDAVERAGLRPIWLAGQTVTESGEFFELCAGGFGFPEWFDHDWDALRDCLTDLTWVDTEAGFLVVYAGWQALAQEEPGEFGTVLEVFEAAVDLWRDSDTPMTVLLPGDGEAVATLALLGH
jgi:hypothetical protein